MKLQCNIKKKKLLSSNPNLVWINYKNSGIVNQQMDMIQNIKENKKVADFFVQDFGESTDDIESQMNKINRSKYEIAGMEYNIGGGLNSDIIGSTDFGEIIRAKNTAKGSLATFAGHDTYSNWAKNETGLSEDDPNYPLKVNELYLKYDNKLFTGLNRNPSSLRSKMGNGISEVIQERTVITSDNFTTNFSTGQGMKYFVNGKAHSIIPWNHRGLQDVLPTYRWMIHNDTLHQHENTLSADFDYTDAFYGGNNLMFSGRMEKTDMILTDLYGTRIKTNDRNYTFGIYRKLLNDDNEETSDLDVKFKITYINYYGMKIDKVLDETIYENSDYTNGWTKTTTYVKTDDIKEIIRVGLQFKANKHFENAKFKLGELDIYSDGYNNTFDPVETFDIHTDSIVINPLNSSKANARIYWNNSSDVWRYEVYQKFENKFTYLGSTRDNGFYVKDVKLDPDNSFTLCVKKVYNSPMSPFFPVAISKKFLLQK